MSASVSAMVKVLEAVELRDSLAALRSSPTARIKGAAGIKGTAGINSAAGVVSQKGWAPIRVRPIPDIQPPIIDPRRSALEELSPFIQGTLAIRFLSDDDARTGPRALDQPEHPAYFGPQRTLTRDLPEPEAWVRHMAQALIEVMSGARPAPQVIRWTTPEVYSAVARRNAASARRTVVVRRAIVRRVRICEPADGVVEGCAVVVDNGRVRALAIRLTGVDRRWVVSALQVG